LFSLTSVCCLLSICENNWKIADRL
jgi:hypothetical protein